MDLLKQDYQSSKKNFHQRNLYGLIEYAELHFLCLQRPKAAPMEKIRNHHSQKLKNRKQKVLQHHSAGRKKQQAKNKNKRKAKRKILRIIFSWLKIENKVNNRKVT